MYMTHWHIFDHSSLESQPALLCSKVLNIVTTIQQRYLPGICYGGNDILQRFNNVFPLVQSLVIPVSHMFCLGSWSPWPRTDTMHLHVFAKVTLDIESITARGTLVRFFPRMKSCVSAERSTLSKTLATCRANIWLFPGMYPFVSLQRDRVGEVFLANITFIGPFTCVCPHVNR